MGKTSIEWTDLSFNPIRARRLDGGQRVPGHFCQKISPGCANCYASGFQLRFHMPTFGGVNKTPAEQGVEVFLDQDVLRSLLTRRKPAKVFWCDMSDLFGDWVPFDWIDRCFAVMALTPHLTHQVLTKRPERMAEYLLGKRERVWASMGGIPERREMVNTRLHVQISCNGMLHWGPNGSRIDRAYSVGSHVGQSESGWPLPNVWLGCSVENQEQADKRIPHLLKCPAAVRFLSCEPLLGPVDLYKAIPIPIEPEDVDNLGPAGWSICPKTLGGAQVDWTIVGGESGPGARPMHPDWVRSIRDQCVAARVPFFFKQWGEHGYEYDRDRDDPDMRRCEKWGKTPGQWINLAGGKGFHGERVHYAHRVGKKSAGRLLDGREWNEMPAETRKSE